ncbi:hypothetical protein ISCGN_015592 [Ixodes scapularis]
MVERSRNGSRRHTKRQTELLCSLAFPLHGRHRRCYGTIAAALSTTATLRCLPTYSTKAVELEERGSHLLPSLIKQPIDVPFSQIINIPLNWSDFLRILIATVVWGERRPLGTASLPQPSNSS